MPQTHANTRLSHFVTQTIEPFSERLATIFLLVTVKFDHGKL